MTVEDTVRAGGNEGNVIASVTLKAQATLRNQSLPNHRDD